VPDGGSAAFRSFDAEALASQTLYGYLAGGIGPRPIAFVATVSAGGTVNLAPYSFFNLFGIDPPVVGFSILQRLRDGSHKDTYRNLVATGECTIGAVPHALLYHQSIAAADYPPEVDEFAKAGLAAIPAERVAPPLIAESPFRLECRLREMVALGDGPGAGHLALCTVLRLHIAEAILRDGRIDPRRIDLVGRLGGADYARAQGEALLEVPIPSGALPIGFDGLPPEIRRAPHSSSEQKAHLALAPGRTA